MKRYSKNPPAPTFAVRSDRRRDGLCDRSPGIFLHCPYNYCCWRCEYAEAMRDFVIYDPVPIPCIDAAQVLRSDKDKSACFYGKIVVVKKEYLESIGARELLFYQLFKCTDGPGCFPENPVGEIDGFFISAPGKNVTLLRSHILGIPVIDVCRTADRLFFTNTIRDCGHLEESEVVLNDCVQLKLF